VNTYDHHEDGTGDSADDNVVRFPRDWLGSRDELIPFGPAADRGDDLETELPPAAQDFWGEESAAVQGALRGPAQPAGAPPMSRPTGADVREGDASAPDVTLRHPRARRGPSRRDRAHRPSRVGGRDRSRLGGHGRAAAVLGLVACLVVTVAVVGFGSSARHPADGGGSVASVPAAIAAPQSAASLAAAINAIAQRSEGRSHRRARNPRVRVRRVIRRHGHATAGAGSNRHPTFVSGPSPAPSPPVHSPAVSHAVSPPEPSNPAPPPSSPSSGGGADAGGSSSPHTPSATTAGSSPSGPTGHVALIGPGTSPSG